MRDEWVLTISVGTQCLGVWFLRVIVFCCGFCCVFFWEKCTHEGKDGVIFLYMYFSNTYTHHIYTFIHIYICTYIDYYVLLFIICVWWDACNGDSLTKVLFRGRVEPWWIESEVCSSLHMFASWKIGVNHTHVVSMIDHFCMYVYIYIYIIFMYSYLYLHILAYYSTFSCKGGIHHTGLHRRDALESLWVWIQYTYILYICII